MLRNAWRLPKASAGFFAPVICAPRDFCEPGLGFAEKARLSLGTLKPLWVPVLKSLHDCHWFLHPRAGEDGVAFTGMVGRGPGHLPTARGDPEAGAASSWGHLAPGAGSGMGGARRDRPRTGPRRGTPDAISLGAHPTWARGLGLLRPGRAGPPIGDTSDRPASPPPGRTPRRRCAASGLVAVGAGSLRFFRGMRRVGQLCAPPAACSRNVRRLEGKCGRGVRGALSPRAVPAGPSLR